MRCQVLAITMLVFITASSGCVSSEALEPNIRLTVTDARSEPGDCLFGEPSNGDGEPQYCHIVRIHVVNDNAEEDFQNNMFYWEGVDDRGGVHSAPQTEGSDALAPGAKGDVTLRFDLTGEARLTEIRYEAMWMSERVTIDVPAY